mgnify:CR=1 FL=1
MVSIVSSLPATDKLDQQHRDAWLRALEAHRTEHEIGLITQALALVERLHGDERLYGVMQLQLALLQTADSLQQLKLDSDTLIVGLLSEAVSSAKYDAGLIREKFGATVLQMTLDIARIRSIAVIGSRDAGEKQTENLRRMLLGLADDVRVVLVILARRLQLMRILKYLPVEDQHNIASVTQRIHAPLANRLGVWHLKWELEDLSLRFLQPETYQEIARNLESNREQRRESVAQVIEKLQQVCASHDIRADISGRPKHIYSIWKKMQRKHVDFSQIFDVRAVRVLVNTVAQCYEVLGLVHGMWQPIPSEFDDYIARHKANGYSSLHTAVVGDDGKPLEIQIRTHEMHEHAERGVAAHWRYKENRGEDQELERRIEWMRSWLEQGNDAQETEQNLEDTEFEAKRIYTLTPQGKVIELPKGATAVDFAYAIHSKVGDRCRGAKADGKMISLSKPLDSGQSVEIHTVKEGGPSRDWLNPHAGYVVTSRARNRIRQWFKRQDFEQHVQIGKAALEREITRLGVKRPNLEKLLPKYNYQSVDDLLAALGRGEVSAIQLANINTAPLEQDADKEIEQKISKRVASRTHGQAGQVLVEGVDDLMSHMAKCCKPVPYDSIVGYITRGRGITVHRQDCSVVKRMSGEQQARLVPVDWADEQPASAFLVDIHIYAGDRKGLLSDISSVFSNEEIDVLGVKTQSDRRKETANMLFTVEVDNVSQLSRVLEKLTQVPDVLDVRRQT